MKKVRKPQKIKDTTKPKKPRQGHKLVLFTFLVIAIPAAIVAYVLLTSMDGQNKPVTGDRFDKNDLNPPITKQLKQEIQDSLMELNGVEAVEVNLKSATLRIDLDLSDNAGDSSAENTANKAYDVVNSICPVKEYFTNTKDAKMYDLEINAYNYLVDDAHPIESQSYICITKSGAGKKTVDHMNSPKNSALVKEIKR